MRFGIEADEYNTRGMCRRWIMQIPVWPTFIVSEKKHFLTLAMLSTMQNGLILEQSSEEQ